MYRIVLDGMSDDSLVFATLGEAIEVRLNVWSIDGSIDARIVADDWLA